MRPGLPGCRVVRKRNLAPLAYGLLLLAFTIDLIMQSMVRGG